MSTSDRVELRLTLLNAAIFAVVLTTFAVCVFAVVVDRLNQDTKSDLRQLADAVIASIDFDEDLSRNPASAKPDLIASAMPDSSAKLLNTLKLQWFNYNGKLDVEKGSFFIGSDLRTEEGFQLQKQPRGMIFTKPVSDGGKLLGYVRVAQPLDKLDRTVADLTLGLVLGTVAALFVSGAGVFLIVRQSILPLRRNMQLLRQFTCDASHELRSPITAIRSNSNVALKYAAGMRAGDKEKFEMIDNAGSQMQRLVEGLLVLSQADKPLYQSSPVNLHDVVQEAYRNVAPLAKLKDIDISLDISLDLQVLICPDDLRRIVTNLLENAVRYSDAGGKVIVRTETAKGYVVIKVEDTGVGIATEDLDKVFDRFWRADKTRTNHSDGQGLGLAITKALVQRHGGSISLKSEIGKGSTLTVFLRSVPVAQPLS